MKYRKKPIVVEAFLLGHDFSEDWFMAEACRGTITRSNGKNLDDGADIKTLEGTMHAANGDYVIRGINGEIYPCKPDIFEASYELEEKAAEPVGHGWFGYGESHEE